MRKGLTFIELIIVVIVVGILVSFAMPQFAVTRERALDREARAVLPLIQAAERVFRMERGNWYPFPSGPIDITAGNIDTVNTDLRLSLVISPSWDYNINSTTQRITATRSRPGGRSWRMNSFTTDVILCTDGASDTCP